MPGGRKLRILKRRPPNRSRWKRGRKRSRMPGKTCLLRKEDEENSLKISQEEIDKLFQ